MRRTNGLLLMCTLAVITAGLAACGSSDDNAAIQAATKHQRAIEQKLKRQEKQGLKKLQQAKRRAAAVKQQAQKARQAAQARPKRGSRRLSQQRRRRRLRPHRTAIPTTQAPASTRIHPTMTARAGAATGLTTRVRSRLWGPTTTAWTRTATASGANRSVHASPGVALRP